jgi:DNA-directed RNA polymerase subunit RPC12/RpoP
MHVYKCAECGNKFETEDFASRCPVCRCKVLIHEEGEMRRTNKCSGGNCGHGCSCGHH